MAIEYIIGLCFNITMPKRKLELESIFGSLDQSKLPDLSPSFKRTSQFSSLGETSQNGLMSVLQEMANYKISPAVWLRFLDKSFEADMSKQIPADESLITLFPDAPVLSPAVIGNQLSRLTNLQIKTVSQLSSTHPDTFRTIWTPQKGLTVGIRLIESLREAARDLRQLPADIDRTVSEPSYEPFPILDQSVTGLVTFDMEIERD